MCGQPHESSVAETLRSKHLISFAAMQERNPADSWSASINHPNSGHGERSGRCNPFFFCRIFFCMRPQHLKDLLNNRESSEELRNALTGFVNVMLRGECPLELRRLLFGGSLKGLSKKTGGLRPIVTFQGDCQQNVPTNMQLTNWRPSSLPSKLALPHQAVEKLRSMQLGAS